MKKLVIILGVVIVLILGAAVAIPIIYKDDIKKAIDDVLAESVNADIKWAPEDFSISLFTNFPNATAQLSNFGVVNRAPFEGHVLFAVESFEVEIDIFSLFGEQIVVNGIELIKPQIDIKVLEDGTANYDIAVPSEETETPEPEPESAEPSKFNVGINHWAIVEANIIYDDATLPFKLDIKNFNHSGSGDFNQDQFDLSTLTQAESVSVTFDGIEYMSEKQLNADITLNISENYGRYTFKENTVSVNDFSLGFNGFLALNEDGSMDMDLSYATKETTFKSLLSLVPGVYTEDFGSIKTEGNLSFDGTVKGKYDSLSLPAFSLGLQVSDGMFQYPDLPTSVSNISMDLLVDNKDGVIENTSINLKQFHIDFGKNPFDAKLYVANLVDYDMDAMVKGALYLDQLSTMFPVEGLSMKGVFTIDLTARGVYDSISGKTPAITALMELKDGYIKSADLPYALEAMGFRADVNSPTGVMKDFKANVKDFTMTMDGEKFGANLAFSNLDNYTWKADASGGIDLKKITKVFPLEGMTLAGKIRANISTEGNMADVEAERYANLPTSGQLTIADFRYEDAELPYNVTISSATASFNPQRVSLDKYVGTVGKSDMVMSGSLSNYLGYVLNENEVLKGNLNFTSNLLDLDEFMAEEEGATSEEAAEPVSESDSSTMEVVQIPENIDFTLNTKIQTVKVMDLTLTNASGDVIIRDGVANLSDLKFNTLGGKFAVSGSYNAKDVTKPMYDFKLGIKDMSISQSYEAFSVIQNYVPLAKNMSGNVSTDFKIAGLLGEDMMPVYESINGGGLLEVAQAAMDKPKFVSEISSLTKVKSGGDKVTLKDVATSATIENGNLTVKPFDINIGSYTTNVSGTTTVDGKLDYKLNMQLPAGAIGTQVNSLLSQYGAGSAGSSTINLPIGVGGTYDDPKYKLMAPTGGTVKATDVAGAVVKDQVEKQLGNSVEEEKEKQRAKIMAEAQEKADKIVAEGKSAAEKVRKEGYAQADNLVKEAGSNPIKKKIAEEAAKKLRKETDEKAAKIEAESKKKADDLMAEARKKADAV
ncbi:AsmA-like C-terminal region-containing protein [Fulvivirga lutea]|uniref:AsmA family protein n=1 Tax=Fulvivirga lutea TaxID=2810512 RepID=A0A975A1E8_9BACT|nr:AsmA-like C-terminal region-containing protein [Fulvivirga lutea]QSE98226.1 AsmA family protein [Fulvivirga lutea]